jgi:hypothetical protein
MHRKLAYKALRHKTSNQSHKMLAMAIAGAFRRRVADAGSATGEDSEEESDWAATITSLVEELTDPYARAILAYVKTGDWANVVAEEALPLKYRVSVALRHLDDVKLTEYIAQATKDAVAVGDIEGVVLTGTATQATFDLMANYISRFGDLQTAVLVLCPSIPRYLDDELVVRKFTVWKDAYKEMMNNWDLKFHRVRFDIASQKVARDEAGRSLLPPAKQQIRLVCQYCTQSLAHGAGINGENSSGHRTVDTVRHPLSKEKAAAVGTVCPKCERHLPRCGVCDMWLGSPDPSYLPWYGPQLAAMHDGKASQDLSASIAGSVQTTLGPDTPARPGTKGTGSPHSKTSPQTYSKSSGTDSSAKTTILAVEPAAKGTESLPEIVLEQPPNSVTEPADSAEQKMDAARKWDTAMSRFTVLCVKCSHGFHASHARAWFDKHRICPVPECRCLCNE